MSLLGVLFLVVGASLIGYGVSHLIVTHCTRQSEDVSDHTMTYVLTSVGIIAGVLLVVFGRLHIIQKRNTPIDFTTFFSTPFRK